MNLNKLFYVKMRSYIGWEVDKGGNLRWADHLYIN